MRVHEVDDRRRPGPDRLDGTRQPRSLAILLFKRHRSRSRHLCQPAIERAIVAEPFEQGLEQVRVGIDEAR